MRVTYEDLLRAARRIATNAQRTVYADEAELLDDWEAVLAATAVHLRWLRMEFASGGVRPLRRSENSLGRLAQAIGAGADLLALQDSASAEALDRREDLVAARAEVSEIALLGARVVRRGARAGSEFEHMPWMLELEQIAHADTRRNGLGALALLAAGGPAVGVDGISRVGSLAVRWAREHASTPPLSVLTRDLRSTTAQLRTVCGYVWHVTDRLLAAPDAGLDARELLHLESLRDKMKAFEADAYQIAGSWRRRLSDLNGQSSAPGAAEFLDLKAVLDQLVQEGGGPLRSASALVPTHWSAARLVDAIDELVWSAGQVVKYQQRTVFDLICAGRLFVPRQVAARADLMYLRRPRGGRPMQARWVWTNLTGCFEELTDALDRCVDHLAGASHVARHLAGTSRLSRRAAEQLTRMPARALGLMSPTGMTDPGQDPDLLSR